ncbi:MAG: flagellar biosynthetic protein FliO [Planctomycetota bacterium]
MRQPALAQTTPASDIDRIELARDQADAGAVQPKPVSEGSVEVAEPAEAASISEVPASPNESLPLGAGEGDLFNSPGTAAESGSLGDGWLLSTLAALGVVIALVFAIRWLLRRGGVVSTASPQSGVVEVLSRTTVAPRSHVVLMRVGMRVLVVSDSPSGMRTLASVDDAEEVAGLLGAIESAKPTSVGQSFGSVMKKLSGQWSAEDEAPLDAVEPSESQPADLADQAQGALARVRGQLAAFSETGVRS